MALHVVKMSCDSHLQGEGSGDRPGRQWVGTWLRQLALDAIPSDNSW